jgi:N-dimethylarginine dimethylaminohydrolase
MIDRSKPKILMCPPAHYGIQYEINPWMSRLRQSDRPTAQRQWDDLRRTLEEAGAMISILSPVEGLPDMVFTANAALIYCDRAVMARFRHPERQGEVAYDEAWLREAGFRIEHVPDDLNFEGAGDALFCGDTLFAGYRIRSAARGHQQIGEMLGCRVIPLELVDPYYYHLDTCFCPLAPGQAIYHPPAFDRYGREALAAHVEELIEVEESEARRFACNAVVVGRTVVTNAGCPRLHTQLRERGFAPRETPLDEFVKAGGSAKCLTLRLDGEEAAAWRNADEGISRS